jgi:hypothetical protein
VRSSKVIESPFCSSSLSCLMIGGRKVPSDAPEYHDRQIVERSSRTPGRGRQQRGRGKAGSGLITVPQSCPTT